MRRNDRHLKTLKNTMKKQASQGPNNPKKKEWVGPKNPQTHQRAGTLQDKGQSNTVATSIWAGCCGESERKQPKELGITKAKKEEQ